MNLFSPLSIPKKYIVGKNMMQEITTVKHSLKIFGSIRCCTSLPVNAAVAMIMYHITGLKLWLPAALFVILLHAFSFLYALSMALTIGAVGAVMMLAFLDFMVLIPMADIYLIQTKK